MIVSHEHRFIFIHCRKVAGSSMKVALARHLGPNDLVIGSLHEIINAGIAVPPAIEARLRKPSAQLVTLGARILGKTWNEAKNIAVKRQFRRDLGFDPPHPPAPVAANFLGDAWSDYVKVCFTRNPFEQLASDYNFHRRVLRKSFTFEEFISALEDPTGGGLLNANAVTNWDMMSIDGEMVVDHVGRYERIEEDFAKIIDLLGLPPTPLGREKVTGASNRQKYGELYTPDLKARVERLCAPELEAFGYEFPY